MRDEIEKNLARIRKSIAEHGHSDGTAVATEEEARWMVEQSARDGILLHIKASPETWQEGDQCYYYYQAIAVSEEKDKVRWFVETYMKGMTVYYIDGLREYRPKSNRTIDEQRTEDNLMAIRRLLQWRDRQRRKRHQEEQRLDALQEVADLIEAEREEAADNRNNLEWLVSRIENLGWEVTITHKRTDKN